MSEELARELIDAVKSNNSFSWEMMINVLALVASWITILFLLKERSESNRPYVQISFELIRSSLACIVIRNVGNVPLSIKSLSFSNDFINQINERERAAFLNKEKICVDIFPGKMWVLCLGTATHEIMKYETRNLHIDYVYSKIGKKHMYKEKIDIDFDQYKNFMVYISEIDELRSVNKEISKSIENNTKELKRIHTIINKYANLGDSFSRCVVDKIAEEEELK